MNHPIQLMSIGFTCQHLQAPIARIRAAAARLGIQPGSINGVAHFTESDVELIRREIAAELQTHGSSGLNPRTNIC